MTLFEAQDLLINLLDGKKHSDRRVLEVERSGNCDILLHVSRPGSHGRDVIQLAIWSAES